MTLPNPSTAPFKTLVYSPECRILIEGVDVSADLVRGQVSRITGGASAIQFTLSNKDLRYNDKFRRMDRVVVWMKRVTPVLVFSGYLDSVPGLQLYASTVVIKASCTLKRLLYTYWDPGLPASIALLNIQAIAFGGAAFGTSPSGSTAPTTPGAPGSSTATPAKPGDAVAVPPTRSTDMSGPIPGGLIPATPGDAGAAGTPAAPGSTTAVPGAASVVGGDSGIGNLLKNVLVKVGGWGEENVKVQIFPSSFLGYVQGQIPAMANLWPDSLTEFRKLFEFTETGSAAGTGAGGVGGNLGAATFSSIGPPASGNAYSDMEIVWIVTHAGWTGHDVVVGSSIIKAESGGQPGIISPPNNDGTLDKGLWQINTVHDNILPGQNRLDPAVSTNIARILYNGRGNWDDWSSLVYHGTAQQHFSEFEAIAATGGTAPPNSGVSGGGPPAPAPGPVATPPAPGAPAAPTYTPTAGEAGQLGNGPTNTSMWIAVKTAFPNATLNAGMTDHANDGGYHPMGMAIDIGGDLQAIANWVYQNYRDTQQLIYSNGPFLLSGKTGHIDPSDQAGIRAAYGESTVSQHGDHVHWASDHVVGPGGPGGAGGAPGTGSGTGAAPQASNKLAQNIFTFLFDTAGYAQRNSTIYTGRLASVNDEPLINVVRTLCEGRMCEFQSLPDGKFSAFYPDYFGLDGTAPVMKLEDVEMKDVRIYINDDALTTHVFTQGSNSLTGGITLQGELGYLYSPGVVTIEDEWLFKRATEGAFFKPDVADAKEMLSRYGVRPLKKTYPNIYQTAHPEAMLLVAIKLFMQKWAEQYQTTIELTFMPELYPGMRVELVGHDLILYVKAVSHNFDYEQGFSTSVQVMAPMSVSRSPLTGSNPDGSTGPLNQDIPKPSGAG